MVPLFIEKLHSCLSKICVPHHLRVAPWLLTPVQVQCTQATSCHHSWSSGKIWHMPRPAQSPAQEATLDLITKIIFLSLPAPFPRTCKNLPSPTLLSDFVQYWPVCFKNFVVGRVDQQINSMIDQMSFTSQMMCAGVRQLWGEAVLRATLYIFIFLYLFSGIHLKNL